MHDKLEEGNVQDRRVKSSQARAADGDGKLPKFRLQIDPLSNAKM